MVQNMIEVLKEKARNGELEQHSQIDVITLDGEFKLVGINYEPQQDLYWIDLVDLAVVVSAPGHKKLLDVLTEGLGLPANTHIKEVVFRNPEDPDDWIYNPLHRNKQIYECSLEELRELDSFQANLTL